MRLTIFCVLILIASFAKGQAELQEQSKELVLGSTLVFNQDDFNGHFAVMALPDEDYNYYVTDLTKLPDRFEKVYFLNLSYGDDRLVNIDPDIDKPQLWFKAHFKFQEHEMICLLEDFMKKAQEMDNSWTEQQKQAWMMKFDKYSTPKIDDK